MDYIPAQANETYAQAFIREVNNDLNDVKRSFIKIGFRLKEADENKYYKELGYQTIVELAEAEFGFKKTTTYDLMNVHTLAHDRKCRWHIDEYYDKFSYSQLRALTRLKCAGSEVWEIVKPTDSVRAIEKFVSNWNEEYRYGCGYHPELKTVQEYLNAYDKKQAKKQIEDSEYSGQLPGQTAMTLNQVQLELTKTELSTRVENSEAENTVSEEPETLPTKEELIKYGLKNLDSDRKLEIYERYFVDSDLTKFASFLSVVYCYRGFRKGRYYCTCDADKLYFGYKDEQYIRNLVGAQLLYYEAAQKIVELISFNDYLTDEEKHLFMQREAAHDSMSEEDPFESPFGEAPEEEPDEDSEELETEEESERFPDVGKVIEIEPEPRQLTNREYLSTLSDEQFVSELCMKILRIFPMSGKSSQFTSTVRSQLVKWFGEIHEGAENE